MRFIRSLIYLFAVILLGFASCTSNEHTKTTMNDKNIMEVTTFQIKVEANPVAFAKRDAAVESNFTSKQPGFIKRQSGVDENGNYVVIVFWESVATADASMNKFMSDTSVADYAEMIEASTMKMGRYTMEKPFDADKSQFVEIMSFDLKATTDKTTFDALNQRVETDFTGKREGFLQRLTGVNETGKQVVAVYWENRATSDASLEPFMEALVAKEFMEKMEPLSVVMGRYEFLNIE